MPQYSPSVSLSALNGVNGFRISGVNPHDRLGAALAFGDINGDGYDDLVLGVPDGNDPDGSDPGVTYVVFGAAGGWSANYDLAALNGSNGFALIGISHSDQSGYSVDLGDVNGDGFADLIIGAFNANPSGNTGAGDTYVVFGAAGGFSASIDLSALNGANGFRLVGVDGDDNSGESVSYAGDVNGDGYGDILIGASQAESVTNTAYDNGHSYVVFGAAGGWSSSVVLSSLNGTNGFRIDGFYQDQWSGSTVAGGGDINGDGYDDLLIGSVQGGDGFRGETYVVFGAAAGWDASISLGDLSGSNGFLISGANSLDFSSASLAIVGDVNGDGYDDFIIGGGAQADPLGRFNAGQTHLIFGAASGWPASFDLATLNGTNGFHINGATSGDGAANVAAAGDFNGDGFADLIVSAPNGESSGDQDYGETYVIFGAASGFGATFDLATVNGNNGIRFDGIDPNDFSGAMAAGGDINGDGIDDIVIGAPSAYTPGQVVFSGEAYVVFGARPNEAVARTGTAIDNTIFGGAFADTLTGLDGDDVLNGGGGADALLGGDGVDTAGYSIASTSATWTRNPNGTWTVTGEGTDTLTSVEVLDFTNRDVVLDNAQQTFSGDGTSDILWRRSDGLTATWAMNGTAQSGSAVLGSVGNDWSIQGTGDFSGDGRDDILWQRNDGLVYLWNNASIGGAVFVAAASTAWDIQGVGDFNFDGRDDFLWRNPTTGQVAVWTMNGGSVATQAVIGAAGAEWSIQQVADFSGDGSDDILWRRNDGLLAIWNTNGSGVTGSSVIGSIGAEWTITGAGDFNGDGYADILWQRNDGLMAIWEMNNTGLLAASTIGGVGTTWHVADVGDYNGDGRDDIFWRNDDGLLAVWTMNGFTVTGTGITGSIDSSWGII